MCHEKDFILSSYFSNTFTGISGRGVLFYTYYAAFPSSLLSCVIRTTTFYSLQLFSLFQTPPPAIPSDQYYSFDIFFVKNCFFHERSVSFLMSGSGSFLMSFLLSSFSFLSTYNDAGTTFFIWGRQVFVCFMDFLSLLSFLWKNKTILRTYPFHSVSEPLLLLYSLY